MKNKTEWEWNDTMRIDNQKVHILDLARTYSMRIVMRRLHCGPDSDETHPRRARAQVEEE